MARITDTVPAKRTPQPLTPICIDAALVQNDAAAESLNVGDSFVSSVCPVEYNLSTVEGVASCLELQASDPSPPQ